MQNHFITLGGPLVLCSEDAMAAWPGGELSPYAQTIEACQDWITPVHINNHDFYVLNGPKSTLSCSWVPNPLTKGGLLWRCLAAPAGYSIPKINIYLEASEVLPTLVHRAEKNHYFLFDSLFSGDEARFAQSFIQMSFPLFFASLDTYEFKLPHVHFIIHNFRPISPTQRLLNSSLSPSSPPRIRS